MRDIVETDNRIWPASVLFQLLMKRSCPYCRQTVMRIPAMNLWRGIGRLVVLRASRKGGSGSTQHVYPVCCFQIPIARLHCYFGKRPEIQGQKEEMVIEERSFG